MGLQVNLGDLWTPERDIRLEAEDVNLGRDDPSDKACELDRSRVLILCDELGRGIGEIMCSHLKDCKIETIIKPGACYNSVIEDIIGLTRNFTLRDYVVIIAGTNDFLRYKRPLFKQITSKVKFCTHTNIIFTSVPDLHLGNGTRNSVRKFNTKLGEYTNVLDRYGEGRVSFVDISSNWFINRKGATVGKIVEAINVDGGCSGNLIFIKCNYVGSFDSDFLVDLTNQSQAI